MAERNQTRLTPPWYTLRNTYLYTIGATPNVKVMQLESTSGGYNLNIIVSNNRNQAECLKEVLPEAFNFGNINVFIRVFFNGQEIMYSNNRFRNAEDVAKLYCVALNRNPYIKGVQILDGKIDPSFKEIWGSVAVIILPKVIQFYNDDLSDLCGNLNAIACDLFESIMVSSFDSDRLKVTFSNYDSNCNLQKGLYC